jgi:hypothetical protein
MRRSAGAVLLLTLASCVERPSLRQATTPIAGEFFWMAPKPPVELRLPDEPMRWAPAVTSVADSGRCSFIGTARPDSVFPIPLAPFEPLHTLKGPTPAGGAIAIAVWVDSLGRLTRFAELRSSLPFFTGDATKSLADNQRASLEYEQRVSQTMLDFDLQNNRAFVYNIVHGRYEKAHAGTVTLFDSLPSLAHPFARAKQVQQRCAAEHPKALRDSILRYEIRR